MKRGYLDVWQGGVDLPHLVKIVRSVQTEQKNERKMKTAYMTSSVTSGDLAEPVRSELRVAR
jgi:hypothetical protein